MAGRILARNGYQVCEADDGADAVRRASDPAERVDLLVTDMVMPEMLGNEVAARVRAVRPRPARPVHLRVRAAGARLPRRSAPDLTSCRSRSPRRCC